MLLFIYVMSLFIHSTLNTFSIILTYWLIKLPPNTIAACPEYTYIHVFKVLLISKLLVPNESLN